jgi:uncharacterized small protein (DUF1192 family)
MKKVLLLFVLCFIILISNAQLRLLPNNKLTLGNVSPYSSYTTHWFGYGHYFTSTYNGSPVFFKLSVNPANPRLAGTGACVVFYDTENFLFNDIQVRNVYNYSDRDAKTNIVSLKNATQAILKLNPVSFNWKNQLLSTNKKSSPTELGFIAQEVELVLPEAVVEDEEGHKLINYSAIIPVLTSSIKELNARIATLEKEIAALKSE